MNGIAPQLKQFPGQYRLGAILRNRENRLPNHVAQLCLLHRIQPFLFHLRQGREILAALPHNFKLRGTADNGYGVVFICGNRHGFPV